MANLTPPYHHLESKGLKRSYYAKTGPVSAHQSNKESLHILGINPWIYDFAAYNFWSRPVGLLSCLHLFAKQGCEVALLDCLSPLSSSQPWPKPKRDGRGHYPKTPIPKPLALKDIPRQYGRYGLPREYVRQAMQQLNPPPDLVLVTSIMTYWYPGVLSVIELAKEIWPKSPVVLGGIYATLCTDHALKHSGADLVLSGPLEEDANWRQIWALLGGPCPPTPKMTEGLPALALMDQANFSIILGSRGCPFSCPYCASTKLCPQFMQFPLDLIWQNFIQEVQRGIRDFAFYDDALLVQPGTWLKPFLKKIIHMNIKVRLHTPNALHVRYLTPEICILFKQAGLQTIRLGLESGNFSKRLDAKLTASQWHQGLANLFQAGFHPSQIGAYILFGLPDQDEEEILSGIRLAQQTGVRPHFAYYTPIPGSQLFAKAVQVSPYPLDREPLLQNNSIWPCYPGGFSWKEQKRWKALAGPCPGKAGTHE